jgi:TonB family protein
MKRIKNVALFLSAAVALLAGVLCAPEQVRSEFLFNDYDTARELDVVIGESKVVEVANPKRIAIGDPKIADVVGASRTEILVSAKAAGETNLQIWDDYGQREVFVRVFEEDLGKLKKRLEDLFGTAGLRGVYFQVGAQERKVFVLGEVPLRKKEVVTQLLESFRNRIIDLVTFKEDNPLVEIDVQVMEIAKTVIDKLGISWSQSITFNEATPGSHTLIRQAADIMKAVGQSRFDRTALTATLNILEQDNLARTLARPKLVALSGKEAKILVGGEVPILSSVSVSSGTTTTAVDYVEYGIKLNIKPEVKETGDIQCGLEIEIKTIDSSTALTVQTGESISTTTPGFKTRTVSSELYLKNNETIFLAGLIDNEQSNNLQQVPGLGNMPIFGALFRSKNFQIGDTELVVSLTPKVVRYGDMLQDVEAASRGKAAPDEEPADTYMRTVQETILKNVSYPVEAQRANLSGEVVLSLHLLSNGQLVGVMVSESSGHKLLDKAAVYTVKRLAPYPAFPKGLLLKEIWVEVPITYQMN